MPLPDSPPSKNSNVYRQLSSSKAAEISNDDFNTVQNPVFIDPSSEDELRRINLVGQATNQQSQSGIIVNTGGLVDAAITDSGYSNGAVTLAPPQGEAWVVMGISVSTNTSPSSNQTQYLFLQDRTLSNTSSSQAVYLDRETSNSSNNPWTGEVDPGFYGFTLTYPHQLFMYVNNMYGTSTVTFKTAYYRVR